LGQERPTQPGIRSREPGPPRAPHHDGATVQSGNILLETLPEPEDPSDLAGEAGLGLIPEDTGRRAEPGDGSPPDIEELLAEHLPMIESIARSFATRLPASLELDDLVVVGALGFVEAAKRYDPRKGVPLERYAAIRVRGAIQDELRRIDWMPRASRELARKLNQLSRAIEHQTCRRATEAAMAKALDLDCASYRNLLAQNPALSVTSLEEMDSTAIRPLEMKLWESLSGHQDDLPREVEEFALEEELTEAMDALDPQQQLVIQLYYFGDLNMREIGEELGLSEGRISQIHSKALQILRRRIDQFEKLTRV